MSDQTTNMQSEVQLGTAIVPASPAPSAAAPLSLTSLEGMENVNIAPANMVIVQATTRDTATPGTFKDMVTGQEFKSLQIVPLRIQVNPGPRVYFEKNAPLGSDPICRSNDGITPATNALVPQNATCAGCPKASWDNWKGGKGPAPECKENARILFLERESQLPYIMTVKGKSVSQVKKFLNAIHRHALMARAKGTQLGIFDFTATISLEKQISDRGTYYVLQFAAPNGQQGIVGRVRQVGEFGLIYDELVKRRDVLAKAKDETPVQDDVVPSGAVHTNQVVDAEVVADNSIPF
jgi:hypothetical protein